MTDGGSYDIPESKKTLQSAISSRPGAMFFAIGFGVGYNK
jgi:hypothetical protein